MNDWLNKTWVIRVISLILAILTFLVITADNQDNRSADVSFDSFFSGSQETQTLDDMPVSIQIDEENYVVSGVPETVSVSLRGTFSVVQSTVTQRNFNVFVNLEDLESGTHIVPIETEGLSNRLDVFLDPAEIEVTIEERATAEYEVLVDYMNEAGLETGFELLEAHVSPKTVQITSSKGIVERIASVKAFVDVEGIGESMEISDVPVRVYDSEGNQLNVRIEPSTVSVVVNVTNPSKKVPITLETTGELPADFRLDAIEAELGEVQVFASEADLANIDEIKTQPIDLSEITGDTSLEVALDLPEMVRLVTTDTVTVNITVDRLTENTIENVTIDVKNLENDFTSVFINPENGSIDLKVSGYQSELADLVASDFQLMIDLASFEIGEHQIPIQWDAPNNLEVALSVDDATVRIE
jgi:YbbR domain-containing protein